MHLALLTTVDVAGQRGRRKGLVGHLLAPRQQAAAILFVLNRHQLSVHRVGDAGVGSGGTDDGRISERFGEQSAQSMRLAQLIIEEPLDVITLALKVALSDLRLQKAREEQGKCDLASHALLRLLEPLERGHECLAALDLIGDFGLGRADLVGQLAKGVDLSKSNYVTKDLAGAESGMSVKGDAREGRIMA